MKKLLIILSGTITLFSACSSGPKKTVLVMGRGEITANEHNVTMKQGSGYAEKKFELTDNEAVQLNLETPTSKSQVTIPNEEGFYIVSLREDTIVGSRQMIGQDLSSNKMITQEDLVKRIDSLTQLTTGANVTKGSRNYIILPNEVTKISDNPNAKVFGPFTKIPGTLEAEPDGREPELYKFYTNNEMRELIQKLKSMTIAGQ